MPKTAAELIVDARKKKSDAFWDAFTTVGACFAVLLSILMAKFNAPLLPFSAAVLSACFLICAFVNNQVRKICAAIRGE